MRARLTALMLSMLLAALLAVAGAGAASASTPGAQAPTAGSAGVADAATTPAAASQAASSSSSSSSSSSASSGSASSSSAASEPAESIQGVLKGPIGTDGALEPIEGAKVTVTQDGKQIGDATTDKDGKWLIAVPKAGTYQVTLDVASLPKTVQLRTQGAETIPGLVVQPNSTKFAIFPLVKEGEGSGAGGGGGSGQLSYMLSVGQAGLEFGLIIAMTAVGLSLIFGTTRLINFAHGELVTIGAVVAYIFGTSTFQWPFIIAVILAIVAVAFLGGVLELGLWRPLRKRGTGLIQMFIISIGLSLLLRNGIQYFFGASREQYQQVLPATQMTWGPLTLGVGDLIIMIISIVVLIVVAVMLQRTRMGKAMRALADNRDLAEASGINVDRVILQVWIIGGGLAALGGVLYGLLPSASVSFDMGFHLLLLMFAGIILGGLGSAYGAMLGSIVVGLVAQYSTVWFPAELENAWALLVLIIVLLVRPQGILGRLQRAG